MDINRIADNLGQIIKPSPDDAIQSALNRTWMTIGDKSYTVADLIANARAAAFEEAAKIADAWVLA